MPKSKTPKTRPAVARVGSPFFNNVAAEAKLRTLAEKWSGTPFFAHSRAPGPGGGVDCVNLVHAILVESGALPARKIPVDVPMGWSDNRSQSIVEAYLAAEMNTHLKPLGPDAKIQPGDVLGFKLGLCVHHIGLALGVREFVHALQPTGYSKARLDDELSRRKFSDRLAQIWRPIIPPKPAEA